MNKIFHNYCAILNISLACSFSVNSFAISSTFLFCKIVFHILIKTKKQSHMRLLLRKGRIRTVISNVISNIHSRLAHCYIKSCNINAFLVLHFAFAYRTASFLIKLYHSLNTVSIKFLSLADGLYVPFSYRLTITHSCVNLILRYINI